VLLSDATAISPTFTTPAEPAVLRFRLAVTDSLGMADPSPDEVMITVREPLPFKTYLPMVIRRHIVAPDLVVKTVSIVSSNVHVVVMNQGNAPVASEFWVDMYVNPHTVPTAVNQTWDQLASQGLVWAITQDALPHLTPGGAITLTVGDAYYAPDYSNVSWPLPSGTRLYVQVDSFSPDTAYGAVLEMHEIGGEAYNNIGGPFVATSSVTGKQASAVQSVVTTHSGSLPRRPKAGGAP
jgi:hypothetical protein